MCCECAARRRGRYGDFGNNPPIKPPMTSPITPPTTPPPSTHLTLGLSAHRSWAASAPKTPTTVAPTTAPTAQCVGVATTESPFGAVAGQAVSKYGGARVKRSVSNGRGNRGPCAATDLARLQAASIPNKPVSRPNSTSGRDSFANLPGPAEVVRRERISLSCLRPACSLTTAHASRSEAPVFELTEIGVCIVATNTVRHQLHSAVSDLLCIDYIERSI
jgi:hypothetical protein